MLRLPRELMDLDDVADYLLEDGIQGWRTAEHVVLSFSSVTEEPQWEEGRGRLASLIGVRGPDAGRPPQPLSRLAGTGLGRVFGGGVSRAARSAWTRRAGRHAARAGWPSARTVSRSCGSGSSAS
jgi:hypothetical protein